MTKKINYLISNSTRCSVANILEKPVVPRLGLTYVQVIFVINLSSNRAAVVTFPVRILG